MDNRRKKIIKATAKASVEQLLKKAQEKFNDGNLARSKRYVKMAMDIITKNRTRLPKELKNSFCKKCMAIWVPGKSVMVYFDKRIACLRIKCSCGRSKRL